METSNNDILGAAGVDSTAVADNRDKDANTCIALGTGVGALGLGMASIVGAMCPLCVVVAPALIGIGVHQKSKAAKLRKESTHSITGEHDE